MVNPADMSCGLFSSNIHETRQLFGLYKGERGNVKHLLWMPVPTCIFVHFTVDGNSYSLPAPFSSLIHRSVIVQSFLQHIDRNFQTSLSRVLFSSRPTESTSLSLPSPRFNFVPFLALIRKDEPFSRIEDTIARVSHRTIHTHTHNAFCIRNYQGLRGPRRLQCGCACSLERSPRYVRRKSC